MKTVYILPYTALALMLSACAGNNATPTIPTNMQTQTTLNNTQQNTGISVFKCNNGNDVLVSRQNTDRIVIAYGKDSRREITPLSQVRAASGELYVSADQKTEWHQKNGTAVFDRTDSQGKTVTLKCHSR